jgi:hypothetical protein
MIELLGYIATIGTLLSFTQKDMDRLRMVNGTAAILWIIYGVLIMSIPVIITNGMIVAIHIYTYLKTKY